jgi:hypothetical protein
MPLFPLSRFTIFIRFSEKMVMSWKKVVAV